MIKRRKYKNGGDSCNDISIDNDIICSIKHHDEVNPDDLVVAGIIFYSDGGELIQQCNYLLTKKTQEKLDLYQQIEIKTDLDYHELITKDNSIYDQLDRLTSVISENDIFEYKYFDRIKDIWDVFSEDEKINTEANKHFF